MVKKITSKKLKKKSTGNIIIDSFLENIYSLNNSKFFAGIIMLMLNIGSKFIILELSETQQAYLHNNIAKQLLIFSIAWIGTRDIYISLIITAVFTVLTGFLFNENSKFCILPEKLKKLEKQIDSNNDGIISDKELDDAIGILTKAKRQKIAQKNKNLI